MAYSSMRPDGVAVRPAVGASIAERKMYLAKVYGVTFTGIMAFFASIALPLAGYNAGVPILTQYVALSFTLFSSFIGLMVALALIFASSIIVHKVSMVKGLNLVAMYALAAFWGFLTIPLVGWASGSTAGEMSFFTPIVFQAMGLTVLVFASLSAYVLLSKKDFNWLGPILMVGTVMVFFGIISLAAAAAFGLNVTLFHTAFSLFIVILMVGFILYDTSKILHHYSTDMVVPGALALMVDFIILFRELLFLLAISRD